MWHWQLGDQWAVRDGAWKLIYNAKDTTHGRNVTKLKGPFLANRSTDPSERTDLADTNPDIVARLTKLHDQWLADVSGE